MYMYVYIVTYRALTISFNFCEISPRAKFSDCHLLLPLFCFASHQAPLDLTAFN